MSQEKTKRSRSALQHTATQHKWMQYTATHWGLIQLSSVCYRRGTGVRRRQRYHSTRPTQCNTLRLDSVFLCLLSMWHTSQVKTYCNTLQHTATHCKTLQHAATPVDAIHESGEDTILKLHWNTLQPQCSTLQHTETHCNICRHDTRVRSRHESQIALQHSVATAGHCDTLQQTAVHCNTYRCDTRVRRRPESQIMLQHTATHCNTLQHL